MHQAGLWASCYPKVLRSHPIHVFRYSVLILSRYSVLFPPGTPFSSHLEFRSPCSFHPMYSFPILSLVLRSHTIQSTPFSPHPKCSVLTSNVASIVISAPALHVLAGPSYAAALAVSTIVTLVGIGKFVLLAMRYFKRNMHERGEDMPLNRSF